MANCGGAASDGAFLFGCDQEATLIIGGVAILVFLLLVIALSGRRGNVQVNVQAPRDAAAPTATSAPPAAGRTRTPARQPPSPASKWAVLVAMLILVTTLLVVLTLTEEAAVAIPLGILSVIAAVGTLWSILNFARHLRRQPVD